MFPPFTGITSYHVVTSSTAYRHVMPCDALFALYLLFLPPLLFGRLRDDADASVTDDPSFLSEQLGKQTLLEHSNIAHFFPSHACIRTATALCMILL